MSLFQSLHIMLIYLMRFSLGKFPHNTISRQIKNFLTKLFFSLQLFFPFKTFEFNFLQNSFFRATLSCKSFMQLFCATRSCNSFMQVVRASRSCNSFVQLVHATRSCNSVVQLVRATHLCNSFV